MAYFEFSLFLVKDSTKWLGVADMGAQAAYLLHRHCVSQAQYLLHQRRMLRGYCVSIAQAQDLLHRRVSQLHRHRTCYTGIVFLQHRHGICCISTVLLLHKR